MTCLPSDWQHSNGSQRGNARGSDLAARCVTRRAVLLPAFLAVSQLVACRASRQGAEAQRTNCQPANTQCSPDGVRKAGNSSALLGLPQGSSRNRPRNSSNDSAMGAMKSSYRGLAPAKRRRLRAGVDSSRTGADRAGCPPRRPSPRSRLRACACSSGSGSAL